jgi:hypothetical protein
MLSNIYSINAKNTLCAFHLGKPFWFLCNKNPKLSFKISKDFALQAVIIV